MIKDTNDLRVAMVLNNYQIVLNAGATDGVELGSSYIIYEVGPEITDPITGNSLGNLELVKGRVWIHQIAEAHSVAGSDRDPSKTFAAANSPFSGIKLMGTDPGLPGTKVNDRAKRVS